MCKLVDFTAQLAEKFPWHIMETEVDGTIFSNVFAEEGELFWSRLNEVLELHKEADPLRCAAFSILSEDTPTGVPRMSLSVIIGT